MSLLRKLARRPKVGATLSWLAAKYIRLVWCAGNWKVENQEVPAALVADKKPFIACFWHGRMLMIPNAWVYDVPMSILISQHRDGVLISQTLQHLKVGTIAGSSSRGGSGALISIVRALRRGEYIGITPDGPRGPRMRVSAGAISAAKLTGALILPITFAASRSRVFSSWDRFMLPFPFGRGVVRIGHPIEVPRDADKKRTEQIRKELERVLNDLTTTLDAEMGREPVLPEDLYSATNTTISKGAK